MKLNYHRNPEKTTVYPKIFSTILALTALSRVFAGDFNTVGEAAPGVPEQLTDTAHRLTKIFRVPWRNSRTGLTVAFSPAVPEYGVELQFRSGTPFLLLNGSPDLRRNAVWRRKLYGTILLAAANGELHPGENDVLPRWLTPALDLILETRQYEEQLLIGNRRSPVLGALLENDRLPSAAAVRAIDPEHLDPAAAAWARELARAFFLSGGRKIATGAYLRCCGAAGGGDPDLLWLPAPEKQESEFKLAARRAAWHNLAPRPARWTRRKFAELRKLELPVLDEQGNATEKMEEFDVLELADRLRGRPDARRRCAEIHGRFAEFCPGDSRPAQQALAGFADLVAQAADPPFRYESHLRRQLALIDGVLARQEKLDEYMKNADRKRAPARRECRVRLEYIDAFNASSSTLSLAARRWVDDKEAEFL